VKLDGRKPYPLCVKNIILILIQIITTQIITQVPAKNIDMKEKIKTIPDLSATSPKHLEAIAAGNDHFRLWERNVIDEFKDIPDEEIKQRLKETAFPYGVVAENFIGDFNLATLIRNSDVFNAKEVFYLGDKKIDRRGAQGCYHRKDITWLSTIEQFKEIQKRYATTIGIDNISGAIPISDYNFVPETLLIFGSEGVGLTPAMQAMCDKIVYIEQHGSIRSLNVGTASGIILYEFVRQYQIRNNND
jgi:tRNA G18 (ribose-2'-O)-methylase SpoU